MKYLGIYIVNDLNSTHMERDTLTYDGNFFDLLKYLKKYFLYFFYFDLNLTFDIIYSVRLILNFFVMLW